MRQKGVERFKCFLPPVSQPLSQRVPQVPPHLRCFFWFQIKLVLEIHSNESANLAEFGVKDRWIRLKSYDKYLQVLWGPHGTMDSVLASHPVARVQFSAFPRVFLNENLSLHVAEIY